MRVLGLIPARGGSKGVARKNIRPLGGKPLLQWTVDAALNARTLAKIVVSTDDNEIAAVARACGATVPFIRPVELAADDTPTLPVVQHALSELARHGEQFDAVCLLQATSPFRNPTDIDSCVHLLETSGADAVISVMPVPTEYNPHWVYFRQSNGSLILSTGGTEPTVRRQSMPPAVHRDGSVYVTRRSVIVDGNSLYGNRVVGYESKYATGINIDTPADWVRAEEMVQEYGFALTEAT